MSKEKNFLNIITYLPLFVIPFFVSIIVVLSYQVYSSGFESSVKNLKNDLLQREKEAVKNKVQSLSELIVYQKSKIKEELITRLKDRVEVAHKIATNIYFEYKDIKSEKEIQDIINSALKTLSWNNNESYIWVMDNQGVHYLLENKKDSKGTSYINFQDVKGRYIIQEEIAICKEKGEGYLWDTFTKPNENNNKQYKQVAFVKAFKPYNWCLGSAEFLDTATKKTNKFLFDIVNQADKIGNNYVAILNSKGNLLVHNKLPQFVGKDVEITDKLVLGTIKFLSEAIKDNEHTSYVYDWRNSLTNKIEKKYAYIQKIPNTDWIITSGFFLSSIENQLAKREVDMMGIYNKNTENIFYVAILLILVSLLFSFFISRAIRERFSMYSFRISEKNKELHELNISLEEKVKKRTMDLEHIKNDFERLAKTDALTNIHNRYSIMSILSNEINRSGRYDSSLSILMYDIDHFKTVNDTFGHDVGDKVLISLSNLVSSNIRDIDYIGRYGGEEFLIIMPNTSLEDASIYAERLRTIVEKYYFEEIENITISIGIVELEDDSINSIFKRVDDLLYKSKKNGRNRIAY